MSVHFDLLGPLTVTRDDRPVPLGSTKQQLILAALLLRPAEAISTGELAAMLWGDLPPASAAANVRTYVRGLRQALAGQRRAERRILTTPGGYLLHVEPGERDVDRFDAAAARGRAALAEGDPAGAQAELAAAVALWRGPALAGLPVPRLLSGRVGQLEERRLLAEEDYAVARIALGEPAEVIPRLRALLDRHPLRQRAWAQLMMCLYQIGDVAGALAAYRQARRVLAEQTGMDPGPELTRMHDDVLHHRVAGRPVSPAARCRRRRGSCRSCRRDSRAATPSWPGSTPGCAPVRGDRPEWTSRRSAAWPVSARPPSPCTGPTGSSRISPTASCTSTCAATTTPTPCPRPTPWSPSWRRSACRSAASRAASTPGPGCTGACCPPGGCSSCSTTRATPARCARCCPARAVASSS
ncbi:BTAD domain-containing putative transcriptional regulator [Catellatospora coxensis]